MIVCSRVIAVVTACTCGRISRGATVPINRVAWRAGRHRRTANGCPGAEACTVTLVVIGAVIIVVACHAGTGMVTHATGSILGVARCTDGACRAGVGCPFAGSETATYVIVGCVVAVATARSLVRMLGNAADSILGVAWGTDGRIGTAEGRSRTDTISLAYILLRP